MRLVKLLEDLMRDTAFGVAALLRDLVQGMGDLLRDLTVAIGQGMGAFWRDVCTAITAVWNTLTISKIVQLLIVAYVFRVVPSNALSEPLQVSGNSDSEVLISSSGWVEGPLIQLIFNWERFL